jgi:ABC-2 type transport system permease protein
MRKLWLVLKREYLVRVRTKAFILSTILLPAFSIGMFAFQAYMATQENDHTLRLAILDDTGDLGNSIAQRLTSKLPNGLPAYQVTRVLARPSATDEDTVRTEVEHGGLDAFLSIPDGVLRSKESVELHARNTAQAGDHSALDDAVNDAVIAERLHERGVNVEDVSQLVRGVEVKLIKVSAQGEAEEKGQTFFAALAVAMVLYLTVLVYGVSTMRSVIEEKSTRVIELLVASVRPVYLMLGKITGVAAVGLTQYLIWGALAGLVAVYGAAVAAMFRPGASLPGIHLPWNMAIYMTVFFLCGYFLYASLYAAVGAMVSNEQEMQQVQMPVTFLIVAAFFCFNIILRDPNSPLSVGLSMIPFFSPILMVLRIAMQPPPFWQIALSIGISVLSTAAVIYFAARIYRVGVLMYGKRPSLVELMRWLKYT